jgi:hypothetical protein
MSLNKAIRVKERKGETPHFSQIITLPIQECVSHFQGLICHLCNDQDMAIALQLLMLCSVSTLL